MSMPWLNVWKRVELNMGRVKRIDIYRLCEQQRFMRAWASAQSRQNLRCSLIQAVSQEEPSDRMPDPWPLWVAGHAQLKFVMTECSKTQIRLTGLKLLYFHGRDTNQKMLIESYWCQKTVTLHRIWWHICQMLGYKLKWHGLLSEP